MIRSVKSSLLFILLLLCSMVASAQRVDYKGGYFIKSGNTWYEYRPQEKSGVHNHFKEVEEQSKWWILDNGLCKVAIPKNPSSNNILIKMPGGDWQYKYTATGISRSSSSKPKTQSTASKPRTQSTSGTSARKSNNTAHNHSGSNNGRKTCEHCNGTGVMTCPSCGGKGSYITCILCHGSGRSVYGTACTACGGDGIMKCIYCGNRGKRKCLICNGRGWYTNSTLQADAEEAQRISEEARRLHQDTENRGRQRRQQSTQSEKCSVCGGTGIGNTDDRITPAGLAPSTIKYTNPLGKVCPYCGSRRYHAHIKCGGCHGTGR